MGNLALLILFNHNYEQNLVILDKIYKGRFDNVWYIMPFYEGERDDVITVYENSFYFQAYVAKALEKVNNKKFEHYLIIGDDLFLNPKINQHNYKDYFLVDSHTAFIPGLFLLTDQSETRPNRPWQPYWPWIKSAINFDTEQLGIQVTKFLPTYEQAKNKIERHGLNFNSTVSWKMFLWNMIFSKQLIKAFYNKQLYKKYRAAIYVFKSSKVFSDKTMKYPLIGSYSDIVIIPQSSAHDFTKYCGIFGALKLFVEIALPTALAFSAKNIISESLLKYTGITFWNPQDIATFENRYNSQLSNLIEHFPEKALYIHPIKFSKWKF